MNINQAHYGDHFAICKNIESFYAPETNIMLYGSYISILKINGGSHTLKENVD